MEEKELTWGLKGKLWFLFVCVSVMAWFVSLLMQPTGDPWGGAVLNPMVSLLLCSGLFIAGFYYYVRESKPIKGFSLVGLLSVIAFGLLAVNWGALLSSQVIRTLTFVLMGLFVVLLTLVDLNLVSRWSFPIHFFKWDNANWLDGVLGVGSGVGLALVSYALGSTLIGVPVGLVPSSIAGATLESALLVGSVALIENAIIIGIPVSLVYTLTGYLSEGSGAGESASKRVAVLLSVFLGAGLSVLVAYVYHLGAYGGMDFSLVGVALLFGFWGMLYSFRRSSLLIDVSHVCYNISVVLLGVTNVGLTLL